MPVPLHKSRPILQIFVIFFFHFISFFTRSVTTLSIQRRIKGFFSHFIWCNLTIEFKISSQRNSIPKLARFAAVIFYWFLHQICNLYWTSLKTVYRLERYTEVGVEIFFPKEVSKAQIPEVWSYVYWDHAHLYCYHRYTVGASLHNTSTYLYQIWSGNF